MENDRLTEIFDMRVRFMEALGSTDWPLDLSQKKNQQYVRDIALRGVEEMFEALQHLKNWKPHRQTDISDFDRDEFLEEVIDAFNYFFELILLTGFTGDDFFEMYQKKDKVIHDRLKTGY